MGSVGITGCDDAPSVDLMEKDVPDDSLEQVRLQLKSRLEEAFRSGNLEDAVRRAIDPEEAEVPEVPGVEEPDEELFALKLQLKSLLGDAVERLGPLVLKKTRGPRDSGRRRCNLAKDQRFAEHLGYSAATRHW